ncbi:MAG: prolyl oligopeptidase family serine peptidase [Thermoanaerobaculia bacterium]
MIRSLAVRAALAATFTLAVLSGRPAGATTPWSADDLVALEVASDWALAPDGSRAAWVRTTVETREGEAKRVTRLWLSDLASGESHAATAGGESVSAPKFSPDGRLLAFLADRPLPAAGKDEAKTQVWLLPLAGGEATPATRFDRGVTRYEWAGATKLLVVAPEAESAADAERKRRGDKSLVVDDPTRRPPERLFAVPVGSGPVERLLANPDWIENLSVSPDGRYAVLSIARSLSYEFDQRLAPRTLLLDLGGGLEEELFDDGVDLPSSFRWSPDGSGFYFTNERSTHPLYRTATVTELEYFELASRHVTAVDPGWERGATHDYLPLVDGVLVANADGVYLRPVRYVRERDQFRREAVQGGRMAELDALGAATADGSRLLYAASTPESPPVWLVARLEGGNVVDEKPMATLNSALADRSRGRSEVVRWTGARDEPVEGILYYPYDWREGEKRPLVLAPHGGPLAADLLAWSARWSYPLPLYRERGAFVLAPNYHGSSGYGLAWAESIAGGNYYDLEHVDLERGVDALVERGLVDPTKLGCAGWSNGAILCADLLTRDARFVAASIGAADVEWSSDWANTDFGAAFDNYYFGAAPYENPQLYIAKSPFYRLASVATPTIVFTGTEDRNVPPGNSWSLFRGLQQIGKTPVRFLVFPGEPHGLGTLAHRRTKMAEELAWFDRYLFGRAGSTSAVPAGSPLAARLSRAAAARADGALGVGGACGLAPETATLAGLEIGRFEVTRAQWARYLASTSAAAATGAPAADLPASGVSFADAEAYVRWLAGCAGRPFRLPTVEEAERLAAAGAGAGNTLARWLGRAPNIDERAALAAELTPELLLLPVGSLPGAGEPMVFDLDGNVAEWAIAPEGGGKAVGPSAERAPDPRTGDLALDPRFVGLRVVVDPTPVPVEPVPPAATGAAPTQP